MGYNIGVTPSFQFESAMLRSQVVSLNLVQQTAIPQLLGVAGVNYGHGEQIGAGSAGFSYDAWGGTVGLTYRLTPRPIWARPTVTHTMISRSGGKTS